MNAAINRDRGDECLSDLVLDRRILGELSDDEEQHARRHLFECAPCASRMEELKHDRDAFVESIGELHELFAPRASAVPVLRVLEGGRDGGELAVPEAAPDKPSWLARLMSARSWVAIAAIAASALIVAVLPREDNGPDTTRAKGARPAIGVWVKHGDVVRAGEHGEIVHPGDVVRFSYATQTPRWIAVLSLDGERRASIYFPAAAVAEKLPAAREGALPDGILLDGALGREQIFGLFCDRAIELEPVRRTLEETGALAKLPEGCEVASFELLKTKAKEQPAP